MPKDAAIGRELAGVLSDAYLGVIKDVSFTYDTEVELDDLPDEPYVFIGSQGIRIIREGRGVSRKVCVLRLVSISKQGPQDAPYWVDAQLDSFDRLVDLVFDTLVGNHPSPPLSIEYEERFDAEKFQTHRRLVSAISITYGNI